MNSTLMLRISDQQLALFREVALQRFADEMLEHINTFFPNHVKTLGEPEMTGMIRYGIRRAAKYGLSAKNAICSYLNLMIVWGSNVQYRSTVFLGSIYIECGT